MTRSEKLAALFAARAEAERDLQEAQNRCAIGRAHGVPLAEAFRRALVGPAAEKAARARAALGAAYEGK